MQSSESSTELISTGLLAKHLHVTERTLISWRQLRKGPPFVRAGRRVLYRREDVNAWLEKNRQDPVADQ